jgi:protein-disulfide isomerase
MGPAVIAAAIIGGSIFAGSMVLKSSLDQTSVQLAEIKNGLAETKQALADAASARPAAPARPPRRGPDPDKRYTLNTKGAPIKGSPQAKVQIVEFSDFQ